FLAAAAVIDDDAAAFPGEQLRGFGADAGRRAGDDGDTAFDVHVSLPSLAAQVVEDISSWRHFAKLRSRDPWSHIAMLKNGLRRGRARFAIRFELFPQAVDRGKELILALGVRKPESGWEIRLRDARLCPVAQLL